MAKKPGVWGLAVCALALSACGSTPDNRSDPTPKHGPAAVIPTSTTLAPQRTVTGPSGVTIPTTIVRYPDPYTPNYDTVASLVHDSTFIVVASVGPYDGSTTGYPLEIQGDLGFNNPRTPLGLTPTEYNAANLKVGSDYVFFYGVDRVDDATCIVGGVRGVFSYDSATQLVRTMTQRARSQIPASQSLSQLQSDVDSEEQVESAQPVANGPPLCSDSATGL